MQTVIKYVLNQERTFSSRNLTVLQVKDRFMKDDFYQNKIFFWFSLYIDA